MTETKGKKMSVLPPVSLLWYAPHGAALFLRWTLLLCSPLCAHEAKVAAE